MNINIDRQIAASSAAGVAIHTPVTPRSAGSTSIAATINTKDPVSYTHLREGSEIEPETLCLQAEGAEVTSYFL